MNSENKAVSCEQVAEHMASVLDGSAPENVLQHVTECDACRDARHDAERSELLISEAGSDFVVPSNLSQRLAGGRAHGRRRGAG